jgi:hypothetical protein
LGHDGADSGARNADPVVNRFVALGKIFHLYMANSISNRVRQFDALLDGERKEIPQYRRQKQDWNLEGVESFHRRSILYPDQVAIRRDEVFEELTRTYNYTFSFGQQGIDPETGDPDPSMASWHGLSWLNHKEMREHPNAEWRACCWLRYEDVESLFRDDLSSSERLAIQWAAANTVRCLAIGLLHS